LQAKRIVITGGPGSGKTSLIHHLQKLGYPVMHEISREIILEARKSGTEQLFLEDPILFSEKLLKGRFNQYEEASSISSPLLFYDRGLVDIVAYLDYAGTDYPQKFIDLCNEHRYDRVFVLPPWEEIYHSDNERYESYSQATSIYNMLKSSYEKFGYIIREIKPGTIEERVEQILNFIQNEN